MAEHGWVCVFIYENMPKKKEKWWTYGLILVSMGFNMSIAVDSDMYIYIIISNI